MLASYFPSKLNPHQRINTDGREQGDMMDITCFSFLDLPELVAPAGCLLDSIDLVHDEGDVLPDLGDFMAEFSISGAGDPYSADSDTANQVVPSCKPNTPNTNTNSGGDECKNSVPQASKSDEMESQKPKKLLAKKNNKNNTQDKRKTKKVEWTPDLHRRFVQAVEQLGVDKAVPSRILELMGVHCLTRHNVASHLQKYRSHRKHLLAREAEAASWSQKRQMYGIAVAPTCGGGKSKVINHQWLPPTIGFPPMTPPPIHHPFRPLHVWGHPHVEHQSAMPVWPKQLAPSPPPTWASPPPVDPSFLHHPLRFAAVPLVPGIPPPHAAAMSKAQQSAPLTPINHPPLNLHPTKESIDAAIGDVLTKPWLPLPIGLKPPSTESVMVELRRQGVPKIPSSACS